MRPVPPLGYATDWLIRTFEIDARKRMTVPALVQAMQEAAMQNVLRLGLSVWDLEPHRISWVLMKFKLDLVRLPTLGEAVHLVTYPSGFEKFFTYRDYLVYDAAGALLASASSQWVLMDTGARRMTRIPDWIEAHTARLSDPADWLDRPGRRLPTSDQTIGRREHVVDHYDLDFNAHLSNQLYFRWLLQTLPDDYLAERTPTSVELHFRAEARRHDRLTATGSRVDEHAFAHRLTRGEQELATGYTRF